jgi:hypothetical protein
MKKTIKGLEALQTEEYREKRPDIAEEAGKAHTEKTKQFVTKYPDSKLAKQYSQELLSGEDTKFMTEVSPNAEIYRQRAKEALEAEQKRIRGENNV